MKRIGLLFCVIFASILSLHAEVDLISIRDNAIQAFNEGHYTEAFTLFKSIENDARRDAIDQRFSTKQSGERGYGSNNPEELLKDIYKWYFKLAKQGLAEAQYEAGEYYETAARVTKNQDEATKYEDEAIKWYLKAAEQNNIESMFKLSTLYGKSNINQQIFWLRKAANLGDPNAQYELGELYRQGRTNLSVDYEESMFWYRKAAEHKFPDAYEAIGLMYEKGYGVAQDYKEACAWYQKSADLGSQIAQSRVNKLKPHIHADGILEGINAYHAGQYDKALNVFYKNIEDSEAQCYLGQMSYYGHGVPQSYENSAKWYLKSAEQGCCNAQLNIGLMYYQGNGVSRDLQKAFHWFCKASSQGDSTAQYCCGYMCKEGEGTEKNMRQAIFFFKSAARNGNEDAQKELDDILGTSR